MLEMEVKVDVLKQMVGILQSTVGEVKMVFDKDGLTVRAVDPAHIAMVELVAEASVFDSYEADKNVLGVQLSAVMDTLKLLKGDQTMRITVDEDGKLEMRFGQGMRRVTLLDIEGLSDPKVPPLTPAVNLKVRGSDVLQGMKVTQDIFDLITIVATEAGLSVESKSEASAGSWLIGKDTLLQYEPPENEVKSSYAKDYFVSMCRAMGSADELELAFGQDYPMMVRFQLFDGKVRVLALLAPRIEND